ncbi:MAG TPA: 2-polyprenyl-3-methyl-6-methoxy-1,4-benzoquinone monooxygenase [Sulfuricella sp.]|nr:2-polyprenyl-3-methyl-6-methoxy-1,4-benzoquinone monooxygenase [Sulfuricella sp.]
MTGIDNFIAQIDKGMRTLFAPARTSSPLPGKNLAEAEMGADEKRLAAALMRVNHSGEVCAQALYHGQALTARRTEIQQALEQAASEEAGHMNWCESRINELGGRKSLLNPVWYTGALAIGALAGALGDKWNLGFLAETERQVVRHLDGHLRRLPVQDEKSRAIIGQMMEDEAHHASVALEHGGAELPAPVKAAMKLSARVMTRTAYWA